MFTYKIKIPEIKFNDRLVLEETEFQLASGDSCCLKGINGSGKTSLLTKIAAEEDIEVWKDGVLIHHTEFKKNIAFIPSSPPLFDLMTGTENIKYISALWGMSHSERYMEKVKLLCEELSLSSSDLNKPMKNYSLGMRYKLFFSAMFSRDIDCLLLDEPFTALDYESQQAVEGKLKDYIDSGHAVLFTTHIQQIQDKMSNRTLEIINCQLKGQEE